MNRTDRHGKSTPKGRRRHPAPPQKPRGLTGAGIGGEPVVSAHGAGNDFEPIDLGGEGG